MAMLLTYALNTFPFPLQASPASGNAQIGSLTLVATNATDSSVSIAGLIITIPVGPDGPDAAQYLTKSTSDINAVPPSGWPPATTNPGEGTMDYVFAAPSPSYYVFAPQSSAVEFSVGDAPQPSVDIAPGDSLVISLANISINETPGTVEIIVTEGSDGQPTKKFPITKFPAGWGAVDFEVEPAIINAGGSTTLNWNGPPGATYTIEYYTPQTGIVNVPAQGQPALSNEGSYPSVKQPPLTLQETTMFTLGVSMSDGTQLYQAQMQKQVTVAEAPPVISSFTGRFTSIGNQMAVSLSWKTNADNCTLNDHPDLLAPSTSADPISISTGTPLAAAYSLKAINSAGYSFSTLAVVWNATPSSVGDSPGEMSLSPDESRIYILTEDVMQMLARATLQPIGTSVPFGDSSIGLAVSANGKRIYSTNIVESNGKATFNVNAFDVSGSQLVLLGGSIPVGREPMTIGIGVTSAGERIFTANADDCTVSVLATSSDQNAPLSLLKTLSLNGDTAMGLAVSPDGKRVYVGRLNGTSSTLAVIDAVQMAVIGNPVQLSGKTPTASDQPIAIAVTSDSAYVFVGLNLAPILFPSGGVIYAFAVTSDPANPLQDAGKCYLPSGYSFDAMAVSPDNNFIYVSMDAGSNGAVTAVKVATMQVVGAPLPGLGGFPRAAAISADGSSLYVITSDDGNLWLLAPTSLASAATPK